MHIRKGDFPSTKLTDQRSIEITTYRNFLEQSLPQNGPKKAKNLAWKLLFSLRISNQFVHHLIGLGPCKKIDLLTKNIFGQQMNPFAKKSSSIMSIFS